MTYPDSPDECLASVRDSIKSAESVYAQNDWDVRFATPAQCTGINIAIQRILKDTGLGRDDRVNTLRVLFGRQPGHFSSSKSMTVAGAKALRDRLYGPDTDVDGDTPFLPDALLAVRQAWKEATGQLELFA